MTGEKVKKRNGIAHVFGPVPSCRLGRSLGVDLVPFKTCTYNCIPSFCAVRRARGSAGNQADRKRNPRIQEGLPSRRRH